MKIFSLITRTTSRRRSRLRDRLLLILILGVLGVLLLFISGNVLGSAASYIVKPVRVVRSWFVESTSSFPSYIRSKSALIAERDKAEEELEGSKSQQAIIGALRRENEELRGLLNVSESERIIAGVISRPNETPYDTLLIDRGFADGVIERSVVYSKDIAIGLIAKTFPRSSLVELFTTSGMRSTVYVFGPDTFAQALGMGGGILRIGIPQGLPLNRNDPVVMPSISPGIIGLVRYVESDESSPEQFGFVANDVSIASLRLVSVDPLPIPEISYERALKFIESASSTLFIDNIPESIPIGEVATSSDGSTEEE